MSGTRLFEVTRLRANRNVARGIIKSDVALTCTRICPTRIFYELYFYIKNCDAVGVTDEAKAESHTLKRVFISGIANYYLSHFVKLKTGTVLDLT